MLPAPAFNFTIPSIHDDTTLQCRIYHPLKFLHDGVAGQPRWRKKGAIIAHPYAPLGGCYDDPVVRAAAAEILKKGFVVGTFNFRGAGDSKGRTSWTAKPELSDYVSYAGCFIYYLHSLDPPSPFHALEHSRPQPDTTLSPIPSSLNVPIDHFNALSSSMVLILGGYSYGSMICTHLPDADTIVQRFANVAQGSAEAEVRLRALHLSTQWNKEARLMNEARRGRSLQVLSVEDRLHSISMGGDESKPGSRRPSGESKRSLENLRKSMDRSRRKLGIRHHSSTEIMDSPPLEERIGPEEMTIPTTFYLLISPLLPPISMFATMFSKHKPNAVGNHDAASTDGAASHVHVNERLTSVPTLALYGDKDFFTSHKKLRKWAEHLAGVAESRFRFREIAGAGHFWNEQGVEGQMRSAVRDWTQDVLTAL